MRHVTVGSVMARKSKVKFDRTKLVNQMFARLEKVQTERLIGYAQAEMQKIGDYISDYPSDNNLDRTGNLLDSLCWAVFFNGNLKKFGYYRGESAVEDSHLHEYSRPMGESVNGHFMAQQFIANYTPRQRGWELFLAVLAPYWGYWEKGFEHIGNGNFYQWQVMTNHYDNVKQDLKPSEVTFNTYRPS